MAGVHGFLLAWGLILPLGAQNVFVFTQGTLHRNWMGALPVVIAAALCDTLLIIVSIMGVSSAAMALTWVRSLLLFGGVGFLIFMGAILWRTKPPVESDAGMQKNSSSRSLFFAVSVSLLNPHAILDTIGVIGTSSLAYRGADLLLFAGACIMVSWVWFTFLAIAGNKLQKTSNASTIIFGLNRFSACVMWATALYLAGSLLH